MEDGEGGRDAKRMAGEGSSRNRPGLGSANYLLGTSANVGNRKQIEMVVPIDKVGLIIGRGGETLKSIEYDTGAHVNVPQGE